MGAVGCSAWLDDVRPNAEVILRLSCGTRIKLNRELATCVAKNESSCSSAFVQKLAIPWNESTDPRSCIDTSRPIQDLIFNDEFCGMIRGGNMADFAAILVKHVDATRGGGGSHNKGKKHRSSDLQVI